MAAEILVAPGDSIQGAINAAVAGDVITVAAGTYNENINLGGKAVTLRSASGAASTTINGGGLATVVTCNMGEGPATVLEGFTLTGGNGFQGGGMLNFLASPTVRNCVFDTNTAFMGGGMHNEGGAPDVSGCRFMGNTGTIGGGMNNSFASPTVTNSVFSGNQALPFGGGQGGGMNNANSSPVVVNCSFSANQANDGGGMLNSGSSALVSNCVLWGNTGMMGAAEVASTGPGSSMFGYCDVAGSGGSTMWDPSVGLDGGGNIDADPLFADADLRLSPGSPCVDAGDSGAAAGLALDFDGQPRLSDRSDTPDVGLGAAPVVDMGAFELQEPPSNDDDGNDDDDNDDDGGDDGAGDDDGDDDTLGLRMDARPCSPKNVVRCRGRLLVALLGDEGVDLMSVDRTTLQMSRADGTGEAVSPRRIRKRLRDVAGGDQETRRCRNRRDGHADMMMIFRGRDLFNGLDLWSDLNTEVDVVLTGRLTDGTPFTASDTVLVRDCRRRRRR